jgi:hypothetical protein
MKVVQDDIVGVEARISDTMGAMRISGYLMISALLLRLGRGGGEYLVACRGRRETGMRSELERIFRMEVEGKGDDDRRSQWLEIYTRDLNGRVLISHVNSWGFSIFVGSSLSGLPIYNPA